MAAAQQKRKSWRAAAAPATWQAVRKQFDDAGIQLRILCYNMAANISNDDIDYALPHGAVARRSDFVHLNNSRRKPRCNRTADKY